MDVTVVLPHRAGETTTCCRHSLIAVPQKEKGRLLVDDEEKGVAVVQQQRSNKDENVLLSPPPVTCVVVTLPSSRMVWREVRHRLFRANRGVARRTLRALLPFAHDANENGFVAPKQQSTSSDNSTSDGEDADDNTPAPSRQTFDRRRLILRNGRELPGQGEETRKVIVRLQPPTTNRLEYTFAGRLIKWEHQLIQAQSLAGFFSTLGGGYFMCHHWKTAVLLAQKQQQMAAILGDQAMFFKCLVHQAYNYIYAGKFDTANTILAYIMREARRQQHQTDDNYCVLLKMCRSAKLFCKRVRKMSAKLAASVPTTAVSKTVDDYSRIRLVDDQSSSRDVIVPRRV